MNEILHLTSSGALPLDVIASAYLALQRADAHWLYLLPAAVIVLWAAVGVLRRLS
jgi:hypothetical protein